MHVHISGVVMQNITFCKPKEPTRDNWHVKHSFTCHTPPSTVTVMLRVTQHGHNNHNNIIGGVSNCLHHNILGGVSNCLHNNILGGVSNCLHNNILGGVSNCLRQNTPTHCPRVIHSPSTVGPAPTWLSGGGDLFNEN